jgi:dynein heavy chain
VQEGDEGLAKLESLQYGLLSEGPSLVALEMILSQVFIPLFSASTGAGDGFADNLRNELVGNVSKFSSQVSHTLQQLTGDITLNVPNIIIESVETAIEDYDIIVVGRCSLTLSNPH